MRQFEMMLLKIKNKSALCFARPRCAVSIGDCSCFSIFASTETIKDLEPPMALAGSPEIVQHGVKQREGSGKVSQSRRGGASLLPLSAQ